MCNVINVHLCTVKNHQRKVQPNTEMPASVCMHVCTCISVCTVTCPIPPARWLIVFVSSCFFFALPDECHIFLTVRAGFVDKITEVEQGCPGGQVLNEPLRKRKKSQSSYLSRQVEEINWF